MNCTLNYLFLLFLFVLSNQLNAQNVVAWKKTFGTTKNETGNKIIPTKDGMLLVVGFRQSKKGSLEMLVFKLNTAGDLIWEKTFGGDAITIGYDGVESENGDWLICGTRQTISNGNDIILLKLDKDGNKLSERTYGGPYNELPKSIFYSNDHHLIIGGTQDIDPTTPSGMLMKLDLDGNEIWTKNINEIKTTPKSTDIRVMGVGESANIVISAQDNGFLLAGYSLTDVNGGLATDGWICKLDEHGQKLWSKRFGAVGGDDMKGMFEDDAGNIYVTGECYDKPGQRVSLWLLKFSSTGELLFEKKFGNGNVFLGGNSVMDQRKTIWTVGTNYNTDYRYVKSDTISLSQQEKYLSQGWERKTNKKGTKLLLYSYEKNDPEKIVQQIMIVQTNLAGELLWEKLVERDKEESALSVCNMEGQGVFVTGFTYNETKGMKDVFVLKIEE